MALDAENYVVPIPGSAATVDYRGDVAPLFTMASPLISPGIKFDEAAGYRTSTRSAVTPSFTIGVLRGRADGLALIEFATTMNGATTVLGEVLGNKGVRGSFPRDDAVASPQVGEFAAMVVGDDLVVVTSGGIDAATFDEMLAAIVPLSAATWGSWKPETPLDTYLVELDQTGGGIDRWSSSAPTAVTEAPSTS